MVYHMFFQITLMKVKLKLLKENKFNAWRAWLYNNLPYEFYFSTQHFYGSD